MKRLGRIVLLGAGGQLARDLRIALQGQEVIPLAHQDLEVCDHGAVRQKLSELRPDLVINTTAFHQVDRLEDECEKAFAVNVFAVRNMAEVCRDLDAALMHFSTDYVFGGERSIPWREEDRPHPLNVYGVSKLAGEYFVRAITPRHYVVRSSGLYGVVGASGKGGNFVETMLRLGKERGKVSVVTDQVLSPTYTHDLAEGVVLLASNAPYGLYHVTSAESCSWNEFAQEIFKVAGLPVEVAPTTTAQFGARALRPSYSVLDNAQARAADLPALRPWQAALRAYFEERRPLRG